MFISKKNRIEVYSYLFKEGVLVAKKDNFKPKHDEIDVPNLEVLNLMKSLKSRGFVRETFNWQYFYWYLENEGVEYLREYLHLPAEIAPATHIVGSPSLAPRLHRICAQPRECRLQRGSERPPTDRPVAPVDRPVVNPQTRKPCRSESRLRRRDGLDRRRELLLELGGRVSAAHLREEKV